MIQQTNFTGTLVSVDMLKDWNSKDQSIKTGQWTVRTIFRALSEGVETGVLGFMAEHTTGSLYGLLLNFERTEFSTLEEVEKAIHANLDGKPVPLSVVETTLDEPVTMSNGRAYRRHYYVAFNPNKADISAAAAAAVEKFKNAAKA